MFRPRFSISAMFDVKTSFRKAVTIPLHGAEYLELDARPAQAGLRLLRPFQVDRPRG